MDYFCCLYEGYIIFIFIHNYDIHAMVIILSIIIIACMHVTVLIEMVFACRQHECNYTYQLSVSGIHHGNTDHSVRCPKGSLLTTNDIPVYWHMHMHVYIILR